MMDLPGNEEIGTKIYNGRFGVKVYPSDTAKKGHYTIVMTSPPSIMVHEDDYQELRKAETSQQIEDWIKNMKRHIPLVPNGEVKS